jgi:predicted anti-sigma-YlaC factor YlaD
MSRRECVRETELLALLRTGRWPDCCDDELAAHLTTCALCAEVIAVAATMMDEHEAELRDAHVPPSGLVWWRAQRRARQEAARNVMRAATAVQAVTIGVAVVIAVTIVSAISVDWTALLQWTLPLIVAGVACATLAPVAIYFALARD